MDTTNFEMAEQAYEARMLREAGRQDMALESQDDYVWDIMRKGQDCYPWSHKNIQTAMAAMTQDQAEEIEEMMENEERELAGILLRHVVHDFWESRAKVFYAEYVKECE